MDAAVQPTEEFIVSDFDRYPSFLGCVPLLRISCN